ncbi:hypothetical protein [Nocardioides sp. GCM10030258]|uniref:hypothetical protein n=1 Tax=unclassified Nocardioides TaxID=2615069 RepID=UPI00361FF73C
MTKRTVFGVVAGGLLVVVGIAVGIGLVLDADAGSMADWVAASATVAAFGAAMLAADYAARALGIEQVRDGELLRERRRAQAALVAAWPDKFVPNWQQQQSGPPIAEEGISGAIAMLRNASEVPVTNVHVDFSVVLAPTGGATEEKPRYLGGEDLAVLPPSAEPRPIRWITEGETPVMIVGVPTLGDGQDYPDYGTYDPSHLVVDISFRDAAGILWRRDRLGRLDEVIEHRD